MKFKTKWDFLLHALEIAILQVRVMGIFPVCEELFPMITAALSRKMSSIFTHRMYQVILPTHILLCQTLHLSCGWQKAQESCLLPTPLQLKWWPLCFQMGLMVGFFSVGKDLDAIADCTTSLGIPTAPLWCGYLKHERERKQCAKQAEVSGATEHPLPHRPAALLCCTPHLQRCREMVLQQSSSSSQEVTNVALRVG